MLRDFPSDAVIHASHVRMRQTFLDVSKAAEVSLSDSALARGILDRAAASALLVLLFPLMLFVEILVKT